MISYAEYQFPSSQGTAHIHVNTWKPDGEVRGVVQIVHGVAEYGFRYDRFARFLCDHGFYVVADDHLGHGLSKIPNAPPLYFGETDGWWKVVDDLKHVYDDAKAAYPDKPYILFGHSMGSFLSRSFLIRYPDAVDACVICGTGFPPKAVILGGKLVANAEIRRLGKKGYSKFADDMAFGAYNKRFAPNRTPVDWVSKSRENVDAYMADPLCGGKTSLGLFRDMLTGLSYITDQNNIEKMSKTQPIFLIAGDNDPVGDMGKGIVKTATQFRKAGLQDVTVKLYTDLRHEILNEAEYETVQQDILSWVNSKL